VFIPTLGDYATPVLVGGPSSTMIGNLIQAEFSKADNWPLGAAMATLTMVALIGLYGSGRLGVRVWQRRQA
jgi:spermidine/putrescine transport system permease protein